MDDRFPGSGARLAAAGTGSCAGVEQLPAPELAGLSASDKLPRGSSV